MLEEAVPGAKAGFDPSMSRHRPASGTSQDISHLLASIFKDLNTTEVIGKDTNLTKTRRGGNNFHDKYVKELQQVHSEYNQRMREADMLENHIIQARVQAMATESQARVRMVEEVGEAMATESQARVRMVEEVGEAMATESQARDRVVEEVGEAMATESQARDRVVEEVGEAYQTYLPPVRSTFIWCVDNGLLKSSNLICPQDYIIDQAPLVKAPGAKSTPGFAKPTISFNKHVSSQPQDDGYTVIPPPERTAQSRLEESETSLTLGSSSESSIIRSTPSEKSCRVPRPKWMEQPSAKSRAEGRAVLQKLRERHNFLRNPRFLPPTAHQGGKSLILPEKKGVKMVRGRKVVEESAVAEPVPVFLANPPVVFFTDYRVGQVYETTVELRNLTAASRHVRLIPPTTPHFSIGLGQFPGEGGIVAPGMSCQYTVRFAPDSLSDYEDFLVVETQAQYPLLVPVEARRPPPILTLPRVLDCGYCLVGGVKFVEFLCCNEGLSAGTFCVIPKSRWPASNLRSVVTASFAEQPPFGVSPSLFQLLPGQAVGLEVVFFPTTAESSFQVFTLVCDNCQVKDITIQGQGQLILLELVSVSGEEDRPALGELCDLTAEHFVRFGPANPYSTQQRKLVIRNNGYLELPFHWQIMKPNLLPLLPGETPDPSGIQYHLATDQVFHVSPPTGLLAPLQDQEFLLTYYPQELTDHHSVCHLVMRDVPDLPRERYEDGTSQPSDTAPKLNDVIVMEIEVKGSTEPYQILLEPYAIHIPGEVFIGTTVRKRFKMWNNSHCSIRFQWESLTDCHIMEVEPLTGEIEVNECFDLELVLTGGRPGLVAFSLQCQIQHHYKPVSLAIEVNFKGPQLSLSVPSVDLGLLRLGDQVQTSVLITNPAPLEAPWALRERPSQNQHTQITVKPCRGVLAPLSSCSVDVLFRPDTCQHFETVLELAVENGGEGHLSVQADVQSPQVCLLSCELLFSELYLGVPARGTVTLLNQTLLPTLFTWTTLRGQQASLCSAWFSPTSATLGPHARMEVTVMFTSHTDMELSEVAAVCEVEGMKDPLVLGFSSKARRLSVSYSLPSELAAPGDQDSSTLLLDFGGHVLLKRAVTKQLVITNHTAIPAPFTMEAEYFTGHTPSPPSAKPQKKASQVRRPLHAVQAKKVEEKAHEGFVCSLLAHGKGAAFFVEPDSGILGPFETQTVDVTAFTDMWGEYRDHLVCKVGDLRPRLIPMQMTVRGCPLYFQMIGPQPENQNQGPIIRFGTHVSGGDTVSRSLRLNNTSPYDIRVDWETYNLDQGDRKLLDVVVAYGEAFPLKDVDGNEVVGGAQALMDQTVQPTWDRGHTPPSTAGTSSSLRSKSDLEVEEEMVSEEDVGVNVYPLAPKRKLFSVFLRPHEGTASDYPYCITPQQIMIPAGGSSTMHVSFTPLTLSGPTGDPGCLGYALGFMTLDSKVAACIPGKVRRDQGLELEPLRLDLRASVRPAVLSVQMEEDEKSLEFYSVASDLVQGEVANKVTVQRELAITRTFQLNNTTEMPLSFRLSSQPPFSVLQPQARGRTSSSRSHTTGTAQDSQLLVLRPQHNMQVTVAFHSSLSLLSPPSPPAEDVLPTGTLVCSDSGERKLRFEQNLSVQYSNNSLQTVPLCAHLALPTLSLSCDSLDLGTCYVGQMRVKEVHLFNRGASCSYWRTHIESDEEDVSVFKVTPDCGVLKPLEFPVSTCRQPLQISFTASVQREFRVTVTVQGILGEPPLSLQVQGRASFDQRFVSPLTDA